MPPSRTDLPTYTIEEVSEHNDLDDMWFTFRGGVYDLSFFKYGHPGGTPVSGEISGALVCFLYVRVFFGSIWSSSFPHQ